jgi:hypothetical protein
MGDLVMRGDCCPAEAFMPDTLPMSHTAPNLRPRVPSGREPHLRCAKEEGSRRENCTDQPLFHFLFSFARLGAASPWNVKL